MEFLCIAFAVISVLTVIGHGIWLFFAAIFRALFADDAEAPPQPPPRPALGAMQRLTIASEEINALAQANLLDTNTASRLTDLLLQRKRELAGERRQRPPEPVMQPPLPALPETTPPSVAVVSVAPIPLPPVPEFQALVPEPVAVQAELLLLPVLEDVLPVSPEEESASNTPPTLRPVLVPEPVAVQAEPAKPFTEMLSGFLAARNILWGELVGGMLIVGCSVALVLSLWQNLQALPYFPFLLFCALTGALFGAGQYTLHHWKLESTSRGLLLISLLLAPLGLLILADPNARGSTSGLPFLDGLIALVGFGFFAGLTRSAGRDLIGTDHLTGFVDRRWLLALGIVGTAGCQILYPVFFTPSDSSLFAAALLPLSTHLLACGAVLAGLTLYPKRPERLDVSRVTALFTFLGLTSFSLFASLGWLLTRPGSFTFSSLSLVILAAGVPALAAGLVIFRRLEENAGAGWRTAGTGVALAGIGLILGGIALAWPNPALLLVTLSSAVVVLATAAFTARVPWIHTGYLPLAGFAALIAVPFSTGALAVDCTTPGLLAALFSPTSACVLALVAIAVIASGLCFAPSYRVDASVWITSGLVFALLALGVATGHPVTTPATGAAVHGLVVLAALLAWRLYRTEWLSHAAGAVFLVGTFWLLASLFPDRWSPRWFCLAGIGLCLALLETGALAMAMRRTAWMAGLLSLGLALFAQLDYSGPLPAAIGMLPTLTILVDALLVLTLALRLNQPAWFVGFQLLLTLAVGCAATQWVLDAGIHRQKSAFGVYFAGFAMLALLAELARRLVGFWPSVQTLWRTAPIPVDRLRLRILVDVQWVIASIFAILGIAAEWSPEHPIDATLVPTPGVWLGLGITALTLIVRLARPMAEDTESDRRSAALSLWPLLLAGIAQWALLHLTDRATVSALRWGLAGCFLGVSILLWNRTAVERLATGLVDALYSRIVFVAGAAILLSAGLLYLGLTGVPVPGPLADSIFARMGAPVSSVTPLLLLVVGLAGTALRERRPADALAAVVLTTASTVAGYALGLTRAGIPIEATHLVVFVQLGFQVYACGTLLWVAAQGRIGGGRLLSFTCRLPLLALLVSGVCVFFCLISTPRLSPDPVLQEIGKPMGWLALVLVVAPLAWQTRRESSGWLVHLVGISGLLVAVLTGCALLPFNLLDWNSVRGLSGVLSLFGLAFIVAAPRLLVPGKVQTSLVGWVLAWLFAFGLLTFRAFFDPIEYLAPLRVLVPLTAALLAGVVALFGRRLWFATGATLFFTAGIVLFRRIDGHYFVNTWSSLALGFALAGACWLVLERLFYPDDPVWQRFSPGRLASDSALFLFLGFVGLSLYSDAIRGLAVRIDPLVWLIAVTLAAGYGYAALNVRPFAFHRMFLLALGTVGLVLHACQPNAVQLVVYSPLALAGHGLLIALAVVAWQAFVARKPQTESAFQLARPNLPEAEQRWLMPSWLAVLTVGVVLAFFTSIEPTAWNERITGALTLVVFAPAAWLLSRALTEPMAERFRLIGLALPVGAAAFLALALPDPQGDRIWLTRFARVVPTLVLAAIAGLETLTRWQAGRRLALAVAGLATGLAFVLLGLMVPAFDPISKRTGLAALDVLGSLFALAGLIVLAIRLAVRAGFDPLEWTENGRMFYVYLAEALAVGILLDLRLNVPELFVGALARYWTLIVLIVAFVGVGMGEWFERKGLRVLAVPLARTGFLLPLIPLLAFWARPPLALLQFADDHLPGLRPLLGYLERLPQNFDAYALIWFLAAALYSLPAFSRRSSGWALVAALAANCGLWALLAHAEIHFVVHPQAWLIPLALILLAAEYLERQRLEAGVAESLRYLGVALIYVSSTADLFLVGLGKSVALPIFLALLSVTGVLVGIRLRVRAFLFMGLAFLLVDLLAMIWHAAVDLSNTWIWWVSGIVLGIAILALFAVFEKRRNDVLNLLDDLRHWD